MEDFFDKLSDRYATVNENFLVFLSQLTAHKCRSSARRIEIPYRKAEKVDMKLFAFDLMSF